MLAAVCADLDTAEAGDACRQAELRRDAGAEADMMREYKSLSSKERAWGNAPAASSICCDARTQSNQSADKFDTF